MKLLLEWFKQNRAWFGWAVGIVAAGLEAKGYQGSAALAGMLSTLLLGAGHFESDAHHRGPDAPEIRVSGPDAARLADLIERGNTDRLVSALRRDDHKGE